MVSLQRSTTCSFSVIFSPFYHLVAFHMLLTVSSSPMLRNSCGARYWHSHRRLSLMNLWELICNEASRQNYYLIKKTAAQLSDHCLIISCWRFFHINEHCCDCYTKFTVSSSLLSYHIMVSTCVGQSPSSREELTGQVAVPLGYSVACSPGAFSWKAMMEPQLPLKGAPCLSQAMGCPGLWPEDITTTTKGNESLGVPPNGQPWPSDHIFCPLEDSGSTGTPPWEKDAPHPYLRI